MAKVYCFDSNSKASIRDRTVYHYTSPDGLMSILKSAKVRFTDCQFLNDKSEYNHIHQPLERAFEEVSDELFDPNLADVVREYIDDKYDYFELISRAPDLGFKGLTKLKMRHYVFCASTDSDLLNMWNYYVKGGDYQGYNLGISVKEIVNSFASISGVGAKIFYGQVNYADRDKIDLLKAEIRQTDTLLHEILQNIYDEEERSIVAQEHYGELLSRIENYRLFFKDEAFSGEKEYRFVIRLPGLQDDIEDNRLEINYASRKGIITPFCDIPFKREGVIKKITIAPMMENGLAENGLRRYLTSKQYGVNIAIDTSKIPIRY